MLELWEDRGCVRAEGYEGLSGSPGAIVLEVVLVVVIFGDNLTAAQEGWERLEISRCFDVVIGGPFEQEHGRLGAHLAHCVARDPLLFLGCPARRCIGIEEERHPLAEWLALKRWLAEVPILNVKPGRQAGPKCERDGCSPSLHRLIVPGGQGGHNPQLMLSAVRQAASVCEAPVAIAATLASLIRAREFLFAKHCCPIELLVGDNDSTDQTSRIASESGARVILERRRNIAVVRNTGAKAASGGATHA